LILRHGSSNAGLRIYLETSLRCVFEVPIPPLCHRTLPPCHSPRLQLRSLCLRSSRKPARYKEETKTRNGTKKPTPLTPGTRTAAGVAGCTFGEGPDVLVRR